MTIKLSKCGSKNDTIHCFVSTNEREGRMGASKPKTCMGCPFYADGDGFVPDRTRNKAEVTICFPTPSDEEVKRGGSGYGGDYNTVVDRYLPILGLATTDINIRHVLRCRPRKRRRNGTWYSFPLPEEWLRSRNVRDAVEHCRVHDQEQSNVRLVIAMGYLGHLKYGGPAAQDAQFNWRGHLAPGKGDYEL